MFSEAAGSEDRLFYRLSGLKISISNYADRIFFGNRPGRYVPYWFDED